MGTYERTYLLGYKLLNKRGVLTTMCLPDDDPDDLIVDNVDNWDNVENVDDDM